MLILKIYKLSIRGILMDMDTQKGHEYKVIRNSIISRLMGVLTPRDRLEQIKYKDEDYDLVSSLKNARKEWIDANMSFEYVDVQEMVDYYTYKIKACQVRYEYFLKVAKEKGIRVEMFADGFNPQ